MEADAFMLIMIFGVITLIGIWNNWICIDHRTGYNLTNRPNFFQFYGIGIVNVFRIITFRPVLEFSRIMPPSD